MGTGRRAHAAGLAVTVSLMGSLANGVQVEGNGLDLELRVITHRALGPRDVDLAGQTARDLLATAGLHVDWRHRLGAACAEPAGGRQLVLVLLLPVSNREDPAVTGAVAREPGTNRPTVLVYVPRNVVVTQEIRRSRAGRSHPALATLAPGHLVGLTIAHEVGHAFGLGHSDSGPMKARPGPEDIIAMREGRLHFRESFDQTRHE